MNRSAGTTVQSGRSIRSFVAFLRVSVAVLIEHDVHVCCPLFRVVLAEVGAAPAHYAAVPDAPDARADVPSIEPHVRLEHAFDYGATGQRN